MPWIKTEGELAEGVDDFEIKAIHDRHESGFLLLVQLGYSELVPRIDFHDAGFFKNDLRFEIAHSRDLVGYQVPPFLGGEDAN